MMYFIILNLNIITIAANNIYNFISKKKEIRYHPIGLFI